MKKYFALFAVTLSVVSLPAYSAATDIQIPGLSYTNVTTNSTLIGNTIVNAGNTATGINTIGVADTDTVGYRQKARASATINSIKITGSTLIGNTIVNAGNTAIGINTLGGATALINSIVID